MINILLTGIGGQGTVLAAKLLAQAASARGWQVRSAETIGMAQRGGSVTSHVRIAGAGASVRTITGDAGVNVDNSVTGANIANGGAGSCTTVDASEDTADVVKVADDCANVTSNEQVFSSLIPLGSADLIVAFEPAEAARVLPYLAPAGTLVTATSEIQPVTVALSGAEYSAEKIITSIRESLGAGENSAEDSNGHYTQPSTPTFIPANDAEILREVGNSRTLNTILLAIALSTGAIPLTIDDLKNAVKTCVKPQFVDLNLHAIDVALQM